MTQSYFNFLRSKRPVIEKTGFDVSSDKLNPKLFKYQMDIVIWALQLGRAAIFLECGMGKTFIQLMWAYLVSQYTGKPTLILAPLAVAHQTVLEAVKFGFEAQYAKQSADIDSRASIVVTNYERLHLFDVSIFGGVVLDESSILKNLGGKTFWQLVRTFEKFTFKLCCTATPAPNDFVEFSNHSTFLGVMHFKEVLARWFTGDQKLARSAVLKRHAEADWWRWLTSWAVCLSKPSDLGEEYDMAGFDLPPLITHEHRLSASQNTIARTWSEGRLIPDTHPNSTNLHRVKRESLTDWVDCIVGIVDEIPAVEPCVLWCETNYQSDALKSALPQAVDVRGSDTVAQKEERLTAFSDGKIQLLITKPEIAGFGLNWQHCANTVAGASFSFERTYQMLARFHRYGQKRSVHAHFVYAETEGNVMNILKEKQKAFIEMQIKMNDAIKEHGLFRDDQNPALTSALGRIPIEIPTWLKEVV